MKTSTFLSAFALAISLLSVSQPVSAEPPPVPAPASAPPTWTPEAMQSRVGIDFDVYDRAYGINGRTTVLTWDLRAQIALPHGVVLDANVPWAHVRMKYTLTDFENKWLMGIPTLGAHYAARAGRRVGFYAGLLLGLPVLSGTEQEGILAPRRSQPIRPPSTSARRAW